MFEHIQEIIMSADPTARAMLRDALLNVMSVRKPDTVIGAGEDDKGYMARWFLVPRNKFGFNVYLHHFMRSDEDRALHDHPWPNMSWLLEGSYKEHIPIDPNNPAGPTRYVLRNAGDFAAREATACHRVELLKWAGGLLPVKTLFITGPKLREWGFWCPKGWMGWQEFTGQTEKDGVYTRGANRGCGED